MNAEASSDGAASAVDRGATLFLVILVLLISLVSAGLALDLSAKENRAQDLQNAADAAVLAGVQEWADGDPDAAEARVYEILAQNGIPAAFVDDIAFPTLSSMTVDLSDGSDEGFLSPFTGGLGTVTRSATASHVACSRGCDQTVIAPPIFRAIEAIGSGDGFLPIEVGERLYSVNHHSNGISCVDKETQDRCWPTRQAFSDSSLRTGDNHHPALIGTKIYYIGTNGLNSWDWWDVPTAPFASADLVVGCFDTFDDALCSGTQTYTGEGFGLMANVGDQLYVFTGSRKVYCLTATFSSCGDWDAPNTGYPGWDEQTVSTIKSDIKVVGTSIYYTMSDDGAVWAMCWDTSFNGSCSGFDPKQVPGTGGSWWDTGSNYKAVINRSAAGTEEDFCIVGIFAVNCWDLATGDVDSAAQTNLNVLRSEMRAEGWWGGWSGLSTYHPPTNQVFLVDSERSRTFCYSFSLGGLCPTSSLLNTHAVEEPDGWAALGRGAWTGLIHTYGFIQDTPDCLIGLGDHAVFFSMKPDLSGPCDASGGTVEIGPCSCLGENVWPSLEVFEAANVVEFNVRIERADSPLETPVVLIPYTDLLLSDIDMTVLGELPSVRARFNIIVEGDADPWLSGTPPQFRIVGEEVAPHLID